MKAYVRNTLIIGAVAGAIGISVGATAKGSPQPVDIQTLYTASGWMGEPSIKTVPVIAGCFEECCRPIKKRRSPGEIRKQS